MARKPTPAPAQAAPTTPAPMATPAPTAAPSIAPALAAHIAAQQAVNAQAAQGTAQVAAQVTTPSAGAAVQVAAKAGFTRTVQNGRAEYAPHTIGALIWQTATQLQALTPSTPITAAAVKLALPHIKPASINAGLSHWRKYNGTLRVKGQKPVTPTPTPAE